MCPQLTLSDTKPMWVEMQLSNPDLIWGGGGGYGKSEGSERAEFQMKEKWEIQETWDI